MKTQSAPKPVRHPLFTRLRPQPGSGHRPAERARRSATPIPAASREVAPLVALAYGLSDRERQVADLCLKGQSTKQMAQTVGVSQYTVQDQLKSIFDKTGARSRGELVGQIFLQHYAPRWEQLPDSPPGWFAKAVPEL